MKKENHLELEEKEQSTYKEWIIIIALFVASFVSIFGIYNVADISLLNSIHNIPEHSERYANYTLLLLFSATMFIVSTIYWKKKDLLAKMQVMIFLFLILALMILIMIVWVNNFIYPFLSLILLGITFFLFNMLFNTIGLVGLFFSVSLFSVMLVLMLKQGIGTNFSTLFTLIQFFFVLILFLGTTYPRIRSQLFKIGTRDNVELDGSMQTSNEEEE